MIRALQVNDPNPSDLIIPLAAIFSVELPTFYTTSVFNVTES